MTRRTAKTIATGTGERAAPGRAGPDRAGPDRAGNRRPANRPAAPGPTRATPTPVVTPEMVTPLPGFAADLADLARSFNGPGVAALVAPFAAAAETLTETLRRGGKVLACGNGGSASDAEHLAAELTGRFGYDRAPLPAIALSTNSSLVTAVANDYGYDELFARQVRAFAVEGDVLVGISTSGHSRNVLAAFAAARERRATTIALVGPGDSPLAATADLVLHAPVAATPRVQEWHILLIHSLCREIEERLFPPPADPATPATPAAARPPTGLPPRLPAGKLLPADPAAPALASFAAALRDRVAVFTNGCFDVLHPGHVQLLAKARALGDLLIVGLNTDASVRRLKGPDRPVHPLTERAEVLTALACVDYVVPFAEDTPARLIAQLSPRVLVKGGDYDRTTIVGADHVEAAGGRVVVLPLRPGHSTTGILRREGRK